MFTLDERTAIEVSQLLETFFIKSDKPAVVTVGKAMNDENRFDPQNFLSLFCGQPCPIVFMDDIDDGHSVGGNKIGKQGLSICRLRGPRGVQHLGVRVYVQRYILIENLR
jgi:hypothetical protein